MTGIVFVGTEGCGKTVLLTVLSKLYGPTAENLMRLHPQNRPTAEYVESAWQILKQSEWPPSTPPGQWHNLEWQYEFEYGHTGPLRLIDSAGQDLRLLFSEEQIANVAHLPSRLRLLAETIRTADAVAFLVNLRDFLGEQDPLQRLKNEWLLRGAMDYRADQCPEGPMCLVFTQADLYREELKQSSDLQQVARRHLPHVAGKYLQDGSIPIFRVSAVGETVTKPDEHGRPRRVPDGTLRCKGFTALVKWMAACTQASTSAAPQANSVEGSEASSGGSPESARFDHPNSENASESSGAVRGQQRPVSPGETTVSEWNVQNWPEWKTLFPRKVTFEDVSKYIGGFWTILFLLIWMLRSCATSAPQERQTHRSIEQQLEGHPLEATSSLR
ncbi:hypothetical protein NA78x_002903 [Anatilimnocola sp. NA78]|uniref:hypothetical protein n=1 Tax=Anatilimnocola sp. NA78 TaxID=3415683 RepID=UPI003CE4FD2C